MADTRQTLAEASMAAARAHARLKLPLDRPIDIFGVVQHLGIWLKTEPLGNLFGFYLRHGQATGIVLNSRHPEDLQRYTCAHELGHHLLGHQSHLDGDGDVNRLNGPLQEQAAQVFAGSFLMPLGLVNRLLRAHDLIGRPLSAVDTYKLSRDMDVSYAACIWRLRVLDLLGPTTARAYVGAGAAAAKADLRGADPIDDARSDVYVIDEVADGLELKVRVGDEIWLRLPERRSSGYSWVVGQPPDPASRLRWDGASLIAPTVRREHSAGTSSVVRATVNRSRDLPRAEVETYSTGWNDAAPLSVGTGSLREIGLLATGTGAERLHLQLRRPWSTDTPAAEANLTVVVGPARTIDGFIPQQTAAHAARLGSA